MAARSRLISDLLTWHSVKMPGLPVNCPGDTAVASGFPTAAVTRAGCSPPEASALSTKLTRTADGVVIETAGTEVEVVLREWPMPTVRGRQRGIRMRMICPYCEASRDALHWIDGAWCCRGAS